MNWDQRFAARSRDLRRSSVRELLKVTAQPEMISFAGGLPAPELFPIDALRTATDAVLSRLGRRALQYGETEGLFELRSWIARNLAPAHLGCTAENVVITTGAQQGLDLIGRILLDPGDPVSVESPTYLALLSAWRSAGARFRRIATDANGPRPDRLLTNPAVRPKLLYTIPNFQNPTGISLTPERRGALVEACRDQGIGIVEDDPYGQLRFEPEVTSHEGAPRDETRRIPAIPESLLSLDGALSGKSLDQGNVIQCGTFSKVLAPGLRVGWVIAPRVVAGKLILAKQSADLHTSTLCQWITLELLEGGVLDTQLPRLRTEYRRRRDAMLTALEAHLPPGCSWTRPAGGMFLLLRLPESLRAAELLPHALARRVVFVPGDAFHLDAEGAHTLRLNFSHPSPERIGEGIRRLGEVIREALDGVSNATLGSVVAIADAETGSRPSTDIPGRSPRSDRRVERSRGDRPDP